MSDLLDKIFLGNVNEKGELDQEGYDQETKTGLTKAVREDKVSLCTPANAHARKAPRCCSCGVRASPRGHPAAAPCRGPFVLLV